MKRVYFKPEFSITAFETSTAVNAIQLLSSGQTGTAYQNINSVKRGSVLKD